MKRKRITSQEKVPKVPISVPQPSKLPEIKILPEPVLPALYPNENPLQKPPIEQPTENPPDQLPNPSEFPEKEKI